MSIWHFTHSLVLDSLLSCIFGCHSYVWALQGLEERAIGEPEHSSSVNDQVSADAAEGSDEACGDISGYLGRAPDQPEEEGEEELTDDDEMFAQFVQNYHESPATTPSKPRQVAAAPALTRAQTVL